MLCFIEMNKLLYYISLLPKELETLIDEYNVGHRPKMKECLKFITSPILVCEVCRKFNFEYYSYEACDFVCSKKCSIEYNLCLIRGNYFPRWQIDEMNNLLLI